MVTIGLCLGRCVFWHKAYTGGLYEQVPEPLQMSKLALQALGRAPTAAAAPQAGLPSRAGRPPLPLQRAPAGLQRTFSAAAAAEPSGPIARSYSDPGAEQEARSALLHEVMQKRAGQWPPAKILAKDQCQSKQYVHDLAQLLVQVALQLQCVVHMITRASDCGGDLTCTES